MELRFATKQTVQQTSKKERENVNEEEKLRERAEEFGKYVILQRGPSVCVCVCVYVCVCVCVFARYEVEEMGSRP